MDFNLFDIGTLSFYPREISISYYPFTDIIMKKQLKEDIDDLMIKSYNKYRKIIKNLAKHPKKRLVRLFVISPKSYKEIFELSQYGLKTNYQFKTKMKFKKEKKECWIHAQCSDNEIYAEILYSKGIQLSYYNDGELDCILFENLIDLRNKYGENWIFWVEMINKDESFIGPQYWFM